MARLTRVVFDGLGSGMRPFTTRPLPFRTTDLQQLNLATISMAMFRAGLDIVFVSELADLAQSDQGVYDLLVLWSLAKSPLDRAETENELRRTLADHSY